MPSRLILDIETRGFEFGGLDEEAQDYLLKYAKTPEEEEEVRQSLSFYPLTGEVVAIGMLNPDTLKGHMLFQAPGIDPLLPMEEDGVLYETATEAEMLDKFWTTVSKYDTVVTFNGRGFDVPFLLVRSAMHRITPTRDLMPNRYADSHIDLMDRLNFFGSVRRRFSLDMWCRAFGITSPKGEVTGYQVPELFAAGRYMDIARYCARDLVATRELFFYWDKYINPRNHKVR